VAAAYTGIMYVYGGTTPAGFDCSGYTSFVFRQARGIELPRSAAAQQSYATPVSSPQPGDLVFYGYPAYHVGIYAGNGMMYDSGRPGIPTQLRAVFAGVSGYGRVG
jgi:cell wall-associated NlpC family hydrolase